ncbi:hypothetical protein GUJ93_ZPchr0001g30842 [Zizania palustris]|uniref:PLATZ transcription factor family protein n=1 Tax=Zizania palustris TaxID=103762 RepID=A0A8J5RDW2_ZIZPA|nr:hypothetical protein GUJ93_ZPchr0001g30842 [Zizania palustris]
MKRGWLPPWLELLLSTQFFAACTSHLSPRNECNMFCIDCQSPQGAFCYYCRSSHDCSHCVIQIRRSSYHNVVRISELVEILDISDIQTYVINSARVVFLNERPQPRGYVIPAIKSSSSTCYRCETCSRVLLGAFRYCSLGCNVAGIKIDNETIVSENDTDYSGKDVEIIVDENDTACTGKDVETTKTENDTTYNRKDVETGDGNGIRNTIGSTRSEDKICSDADYNKETPSSTRVIRHRRKGIPRRAPFF